MSTSLSNLTAGASCRSCWLPSSRHNKKPFVEVVFRLAFVFVRFDSFASAEDPIPFSDILAITEARCAGCHGGSFPDSYNEFIDVRNGLRIWRVHTIHRLRCGVFVLPSGRTDSSDLVEATRESQPL